MNRSQKIYVASSWKNERYPKVIKMLKDQGCKVYDFRNPGEGKEGFHWTQVTDEPQPWSFDTYRQVLAHPRSVQGFNSDMRALQEADICIVVMPCGRSAHLEAGYAVGSGKLTIFLWEEVIDQADLMPLMAHYHVKTLAGLKRALDLMETNNKPQLDREMI